MANNQQKAIIHVLKAKLNLLDEHYRDMLASYGVTSAGDKRFTFSDAKNFIQLLTKMCRDNNIPTRKPQPRGMVTHAQMSKIRAMWSDVSRQKSNADKNKSLDRFIENKFKISKLEWLPSELVGKIIKTLEIMKEQSCKTKNT